MGVRGGNAEKLKKKGSGKKMEEESKPAPSKTEGCGTQFKSLSHAPYCHLSVNVLVLFLGSYLASIFSMSITTGTLARRPAKMQVPVGRIGRYSKEILSR